MIQKNMGNKEENASINGFSIFKKNRVTVESLLKKIKQKEKIEYFEMKKLLENTYHMLNFSSCENDYNLGLSVICHVAESNPEESMLKQLLYDCIISSRVFLYNEMYGKLDKNYLSKINESIFDNVALENYRLETGIVLTKTQKDLLEVYQKNKKLIVSAPTSFGKSTIVPEMIIKNNYKNSAIVLPTIALLSETYHKYIKNPCLKEYNIITSLSQEPSDVKNIFIFTPERMDIYLDQHKGLEINFFTMDEIYKIQDDKERREIFTHCLYRLSKMKSDFYLIGPYFKGFSENFIKKTGAVFKKYSTEIVQKDDYNFADINIKDEFEINGKKIRKIQNKEKNLIKLLTILSGQTLVYVGTKYGVEVRAKNIATGLNREYKNELIDYIKDNISSNWSLVKCLEKGVAYHHAGIPRYIQKEIVDMFNDGYISVIVCSSTLAEGVNTSAKNVVIFDDCKGKEPLSGFDIKNIKGRAGRFSVHFIGNVINFERVTEGEKGLIEFSYLDKLLTAEETIQIEKNELNGENLEIRENVEQQLEYDNIPLDIIKQNKFIPVHAQVILVKTLRTYKYFLDAVFFEENIPNKEQLDNIIYLCYTFLFSEHEKGYNFSLGEIQRQTKYYIYRLPNIKEMIINQNGETEDTKIRNTFKFISSYFEFLLPKYFKAFELLFNLVYEEEYKIKGINLQYLITLLEFGFVKKHEIALKEAGIPINIIKKIENKFCDCENIEAIRVKFRYNPKLIEELIPYERKIFIKYI